jgi:hypothetical protein
MERLFNEAIIYGTAISFEMTPINETFPYGLTAMIAMIQLLAYVDSSATAGEMSR